MNIKIDEKNLTAASVMPLFEAAQKIADMTGEMVTINAYDGIKFEPAPKDEIDAPVMPNIEPHKWPDLDDSNSSKGSDDPFAVDWSKAPASAIAHTFNENGLGRWWSTSNLRKFGEFGGHGLFAVPDGVNEKTFETGDNWINSGNYVAKEHLQKWNESLRLCPQVPCTITTSSLLKDQAS